LDQAKRQAEARQAGLEDEVALLVTHGVLHLLGYDHQEKSQKLIMRRKEQSYLKSLKEVTIEK
jgi:probable rRNA maturation factor